MYENELEAGESQEAKNERRTRLEELTLQFLERGEKVKEIPRGKSAKRLYCKMNSKNKSGSPTMMIEGKESYHRSGKHPHSQMDFSNKKEAPKQ